MLMGAGDDPQGQSWIAGFQQRLAELGWLDGPDVQVDVHWGGADMDYIRRTAAELALERITSLASSPALGHDIRLMPAQYVKPSLKG
jgi:hypothetical protein